uniref:Uncharacterized protein n=1 Tax=Cucumis melo TaxID=3656 RepID=A0A9I9EKD8_CUCME
MTHTISSFQFLLLFSFSSHTLPFLLRTVAATTTTVVLCAHPVPATTIVTLPFLRSFLCLPPPSVVLFFDHVRSQPSPPPLHVRIYLIGSNLVCLWPDMLQERRLAVVRKKKKLVVGCLTCLRNFLHWFYELAYSSNQSLVINGGGRKPWNSIDFICAHDGFTLADLVTYNSKHNLANSKDNNDGENHNNSWNCGQSLTDRMGLGKGKAFNNTRVKHRVKRSIKVPTIGNKLLGML